MFVLSTNYKKACFDKLFLQVETVVSLVLWLVLKNNMILQRVSIKNATTYTIFLRNWHKHSAKIFNDIKDKNNIFYEIFCLV